MTRPFFDEAAYLFLHPDVADGVNAGQFRSGLEHYLSFGRAEGRDFPRASRIPDVSAIPAGVAAAEGRLAVRSSDPRELLTLLRPTSASTTESRDWTSLALGERVFAGPGGALMLTCETRAIHRQGGFFMLEVLPDMGRLSSSSATLHARSDSSATDARPQKIALTSRSTSKRIVQLPPGCSELTLEFAAQCTRIRIRSLRLVPVLPFWAFSRIRARLVAAGEPDVRNTLLHRYRVPEGAEAAKLLAAYEDLMARRTSVAQAYDTYIETIEADLHAEIEATLEARLQQLGSTTRFSVLVPIYDPSKSDLEACLDSILRQSYPHLEICAVDDCSTAPHVRSVLQTYAARDPRVRVHYRATNGHICRSSQDALDMATGTHVALVDHDDTLAPHALLMMAEAIAAQPTARFWYGDEDKLDLHGRRKEPHFKSDFGPDHLLAQNYICHLTVASTERVRAVGGFRVGYEGAQDHDLVLRLADGASRHDVVHVPHITYHWREGLGSTALNPDSKTYTELAGIAAIRDALDRRGIDATVEHGKVVRNSYWVRFALPEPAPRVSIIIPTRDAVELMKTCVGSILRETKYPDYEIIIVDNGSVEPATFAFFEEATKDSRVRVLRDDRPFNYSALNNAAAKIATGSILALVNNDIEVTDGDWMRELASHAARDGVGCVGALLLYPDSRIQHAGVVLGPGGVADHFQRLRDRGDVGYFGRSSFTHDISAVTGACLFVKRSIYFEVGGLEEVALTVAFNDVDFCIRVREAGYRNLFTPHAVLFHYESATRGDDRSPERRDRFQREVLYMRDRWAEILDNDPYYPRVFTRKSAEFEIELSPEA